MSAIPFVIGQWVSGERFYGRCELLARLGGSGASGASGAGRSWVVGLRRTGKTSLLKQLERLAAGSPRPVLPLLWDLQGVDGPRELALSLADALLEAEEPLERWEIHRDELNPGELELDDAASGLGRLAAALARRGAELLLLLDEAEELVAVERGSPGTAAGLWQALAPESAPESGAQTGVRIVLASSPRLEERSETDPAATWVRSFGDPIYLGPLTPDAARALVRQDQLPSSARPTFDTATVEALCQAGGGHPMLLQMLAKRCFELGDAERAIAQLEADRTVDHLFTVDLELLTAAERERLRALARGTALAAGAPHTARLCALGWLMSTPEGMLRFASRLLASWFAR